MLGEGEKGAGDLGVGGTEGGNKGMDASALNVSLERT